MNVVDVSREPPPSYNPKEAWELLKYGHAAAQAYRAAQVGQDAARSREMYQLAGMCYSMCIELADRRPEEKR